ncbi:MAG: pyruvate formate lyase family protein [Candidatus Bathyarchaeia archaeon]
MEISDAKLNDLAKNRIKKLLDNIRVEGYTVCLERLRLITESWKKTEGQPTIIRVAKAFSHVLDNMTIFIEDGELIVGNGASKPMGLEFNPFFGPISIEELKKLEREGFIKVSEKDWPEIEKLAEYWKDKNFQFRMSELLNDEHLWLFAQTGILLPPFNSREECIGGLLESGISSGVNRWIGVIDFERVLNHGLNKIIREAEEELRKIRFIGNADAVNKTYFLKAVIIALKAVIRFANRYAELAKKMATFEQNPQRRKELERIAETCRWVPANPARNFYEALQSFWFIYLVTQQSTASAGRFDQYMYPFYMRDKNTGNITDEEVLELLCLLRIKDMHLLFVPLRDIKRQQYAGFAKWHNFTIGGITPEGTDATNELTYLMLEAAKIVRTPHPTLTLRVHEGTPDDLIVKALEVVRMGLGMPAFIGDKSYIEFLLSKGLPLDWARDYCVAGCIEPSIAGRSRQPKCTFFVAPKVLEIFINGGLDPRTGLKVGPFEVNVEDFKSFDEFVNAFKQYLAYFAKLAAELINIELACQKEFPPIVDSALMVDAIKEGKSLLDRKMPYENGAAISLCGMINVANSLAAIKRLVFEEKKITMRQLKKALAANWQGYEDIRRMCLQTPKYGNDDDYVDQITKDLYKFWADILSSLYTIWGERFLPAAISITSQWAGGAITGASPDGRFAGECLADGGASPQQGTDVNGPTAVIKSALKIDQTRFQSVLLNMKFHPSALKTVEDLRKLAVLIKTYFSMGGKHIQFNVVGRETLLEAQKHPEKYRDLIVRVAGYSAYFTQLSRGVQDDIIRRTEHITI